MKNKLESLILQLDFEEIMNDDEKKIQKLKSEIRDLKLTIILNQEIKDEPEIDYFEDERDTES